MVSRRMGLQEAVFSELFEVAELANFSREEQDIYQNSLKYYRDLNNVVDTSREEGREEGQRSLLLRLLIRKLGAIPEAIQEQIARLSGDDLETLGDLLLEFDELQDLVDWLARRG
jgi:hypothetical protein